MAKKKKELNTPGLFDEPKDAKTLRLENVHNLYTFLYQWFVKI